MIYVIGLYSKSSTLWSCNIRTNPSPFHYFDKQVLTFHLPYVHVESASMMRPFIVIVAATASSLSIGRHGKLPWRLAQDMLYFKNVTTNTTTKGRMNAVIMGRRTWESIPQKFRPLSNRLNVVLSRNPKIRQELGIPQEVCVFSSLQEALAELSQVCRIAEIAVLMLRGKNVGSVGFRFCLTLRRL